MPRFHCRVSVGNKSEKKLSVAKVRYILREGGRYRRMPDPIYQESGNMPFWALQPLDFWRANDRYERENGRLYVQVVFNLSPELSLESQVSVVHQNLEELFGKNRLPYTFAIHNEFNPKNGTMNPHCHLIISESADDGIARWPETYFRRSPIGVRKVGILRKGDKIRYFKEAACAILNGELRKFELTSRYEHRRFDELFDELEGQIKDLEKDGRIREALDLKLEQLKLCREPEVHEGYSPAKKKQNEEIRKRNEEKAKSLEPYAEAFMFLTALELFRAQQEKEQEQSRLGFLDKFKGLFGRTASETMEPIGLMLEKIEVPPEVQNVAEIPEVESPEAVAEIEVVAESKWNAFRDDYRVSDYNNTGAAEKLYQFVLNDLQGVKPGMDFKKWVLANWLQRWDVMEPFMKQGVVELLNEALDRFSDEALEIRIEQMGGEAAEAKRKAEEKRVFDLRKAEADKISSGIAMQRLVEDIEKEQKRQAAVRDLQEEAAADRVSKGQVAFIGATQPEDLAASPGRKERQEERVRRPARPSRDDDGPEIGR